MELGLKNRIAFITGAIRGDCGVIALACCSVFAILAADAQAQNYPNHPIRMLIPFAPGGGQDTTGRIIGHKLAEVLGQQVVVDNRPGGGGVIAYDTAAKAPADGYTLVLASAAFTVLPSLQRNLPYDPLRDFAPITRVSIVPATLIVHASLPVKSVRELFALARAKSGQITFGSAGVGSSSHLCGELFNLLAHVKLVHVPYKGSGPVSTALLSGEIAVSFSNPTASLPHVKAGRLRMLAVTTPQRWPLLPDVPTVAESGVPGYEVVIWSGLLTSVGAPPAVIARLHRELAQILKSADTTEHLAVHGERPLLETPEEFAAFLKNETTKWARVVREGGITAN